MLALLLETPRRGRRATSGRSRGWAVGAQSFNSTRTKRTSAVGTSRRVAGGVRSPEEATTTRACAYCTRAGVSNKKDAPRRCTPNCSVGTICRFHAFTVCVRARNLIVGVIVWCACVCMCVCSFPFKLGPAQSTYNHVVYLEHRGNPLLIGVSRQLSDTA